MIKCGSITNPETGVTKDIIVKSNRPVSYIQLAVFSGVMAVGVTYLVSTAFTNGVKAAVQAEIHTMSDLGLITEK